MADPWSQVEDLDGKGHYRVLGLDQRASAGDVRRAYRQLARRHHPDKGGTPAAFARLRRAFEVLSDPVQRDVYDTWAHRLEFRYVTDRCRWGPAGGEDALLNEFGAMGMRCDPATQLVPTCELCRRPAGKACWVCGARLCNFCTLKRHWKGPHGLHWPLVDSPHMARKLALREFERKRVEDAKHADEADPNHRTAFELRTMRAFVLAAGEAAKQPDRRTRCDVRLARFYMWAQTEAFVHVAVHVPTGFRDGRLDLEASESGLRVHPPGSPPVVDRLLAGCVCLSAPVETFATPDNMFVALSLPKARVGERWVRLFRGDSDGARCLEPPYSIHDHGDGVTVELRLPFWIEPEDVAVEATQTGLRIAVRNTLSISRHFWTRAGHPEAPGDTVAAPPVVPDSCTWSMDGGRGGRGDKTLTVAMAKPDLTESEVTWKGGRREDNRAKERGDGSGRKGVRFFVDDEDEFGLEDVLQAMCMREAGRAYVPAKPWGRDTGGHRVDRADELSPEAQKVLEAMEARAKEGEGER